MKLTISLHPFTCLGVASTFIRLFRLFLHGYTLPIFRQAVAGLLSLSILTLSGQIVPRENANCTSSLISYSLSCSPRRLSRDDASVSLLCENAPSYLIVDSNFHGNSIFE